MILSFKTHIEKKPTHFVQKILACVMPEFRKDFHPKIHTIRKGDRWKAGMLIHMATGVRTKNYFRFNGDGIGLDVCKSVQEIEIKHSSEKNKEILIDGELAYVVSTGKYITSQIFYPNYDFDEFVKNDGFESISDFFKFFNEDFEGQIIHWTDLKY